MIFKIQYFLSLSDFMKSIITYLMNIVKNLQYYVLTGVMIIALIACKKENTPPVALFSIFPPGGDTTTIFVFDASESYDAENPYYALMVRWDWDNDGEWDTDYSFEKKNVWKFPNPGTHSVKLEVIDLKNATNSTTSTLYSWGKNTINTMTDPRDDQVYNIVEINNQLWMAENLNIGIMIHDSVRASNNGIIEKYLYNNQENNQGEGGSNTYYLWEEAMGYNMINESGGDICPPGWHLPEANDWIELFDGYPETFISRYFEIGGLSSLSLSRSSFLRIQESDYPRLSDVSPGIYWTSDYIRCDTCYLKFNPKVAEYTDWLDNYENVKGLINILNDGNLPGLYTFFTDRYNNLACPIRCIKD